MPIPLGIWATAGAGDAAGDKYVAISAENGVIYAYPWSVSGFGTKFTDTTSYGGNQNINFFRNGNDIVNTSNGGSDWNAFRFSSAGWGTKYTVVYGGYTHPWSSVSPLNNAVTAPIANIGAFVEAYPFVSNSGFGTKFSNPSTGYTGDYAAGSAFSSDGLAVAYSDENYSINAWKFSGSGYGTKFSSPSNASGPSGRLTFTPNALIAAHQVSPYTSAWPFNSTSGFGSRYSNPGGGFPTTANQGGVASTVLGDFVFFAGDTGSYAYAYPWSASGFGSKFSNPSPSPNISNPSNPQVATALSGKAVGFATNVSPYVNIYAWSAAGWGTKYSDPASPVGNKGRSISFA